MSINPENVGEHIVRLRTKFRPKDYSLRDTEIAYLLGVAEAAALLWATHEEYGGMLSAHEMAMQFRRLSAALRDDLGAGYGASPQPETAP